MGLAENAGRKKSPKNCHLRTIVQVCRAISSQLRHVSTIGKKLLSSNISSRCSHNMVNFDLLAAEIGPVVWGTPANFNCFHVLAALLHGSQVVGVSQTAALNRGRQLCSAGRPSRWALAHILVFDNFWRILISYAISHWRETIDCWWGTAHHTLILGTANLLWVLPRQISRRSAQNRRNAKYRR